MKAEDHLGRVLKLLQGSIRAAGFTQTEVDERIGRRRGYLSHVFQRRVDLKLVDLLRVLRVLELQPGRFFQAAVGIRGDARASLEDLMQLMAEVGDGRRERESQSAWQPQAPPAEPPEEDRELMKRVRAAVRRILAEDVEGEEVAHRLRETGGSE